MRCKHCARMSLQAAVKAHTTTTNEDRASQWKLAESTNMSPDAKWYTPAWNNSLPSSHWMSFYCLSSNVAAAMCSVQLHWCFTCCHLCWWRRFCCDVCWCLLCYNLKYSVACAPNAKLHVDHKQCLHLEYQNTNWPILVIWIRKAHACCVLDKCKLQLILHDWYPYTVIWWWPKQMIMVARYFLSAFCSKLSVSSSHGSRIPTVIMLHLQ